jgi:hypothetical protein
MAYELRESNCAAQGAARALATLSNEPGPQSLIHQLLDHRVVLALTLLAAAPVNVLG